MIEKGWVGGEGVQVQRNGLRGEEETEKGEVVGAARHTLQGMGQYSASSCPVTICHTLLRPFSPISGPGRQSFEKTGFFAEFLAGNLFCIRICMNVELYPYILYVIILCWMV
jgi:hypothetical protein